MLFSYGKGEYIEGSRVIQGEVVLSQYKLYLKNEGGDITQTYIALEKIERIKVGISGVTIFIRHSLLERYQVLLKLNKSMMNDLVKEIVERRCLKKRFLRKEWFDGSV